MCKGNFTQYTKAQHRYWFSIGVVLMFLIGGFVILAYLLQGIDWSRFRQLGLASLPLILGSLLIGTGLYTLAVYILLHSSGIHATLSRTYLVLTASLSANYVTPIKAGIPLRIYLYHRFMDIAVGTGTALVAIETLIGMFTPALAATFGIVFLSSDISIYTPVVLLVTLIVGISVICLKLTRFVTPLLAYLARYRSTQRLAGFLEQVHMGLSSVPVRTLLQLIILFMLNFAIHAIRMYLVLHVLGYPVDPVALFFILTVSITAGNVSMIPMGLGVQDASFVVLLTQLGIPNEIALSAAVIQRLFVPGWPLFLSLISLNLLGLVQIKRHKSLIAR